MVKYVVNLNCPGNSISKQTQLSLLNCNGRSITMALYYNLVFVLLVVEMAFFAILSLPFPRALRKTVLRSVSAPFQSEQFQIALKCIFGFVAVLFIDSVNRVYSVSAELQSFSPSGMSALNLINDRAEVQSRRFYSQRNMYLCGFALFLTLILIRTYSLVAELIQTKDKLDLIKKEDAAPDSEENAALKLELEEKSAQLETLKEQAAALSNEFDSVSSVKSRKTK